MTSLFLDAGHSLSQAGAIAAYQPSLQEALLTIELKNILIDKIKALNHQLILHTDNNRHSLKATIQQAKSLLSPDDYFLSLHFNASASQSASGVECYVKSLSSNASLASSNKLGAELCKSIASLLSIPNRGLKTPSSSSRGSLGVFSIPAHILLLEICFLSNPQDMLAYRTNFQTLSNEIAKLIVKHISSHQTS